MKSDHHDKKLFGTATVGSKGQIVIPSDAREQFSIEAGERLYVVGAPGKNVLILIKEEEMSKFVEHVAEGAEQFKAQFEEIKGK